MISEEKEHNDDCCPSLSSASAHDYDCDDDDKDDDVSSLGCGSFWETIRRHSSSNEGKLQRQRQLLKELMQEESVATTTFLPPPEIIIRSPPSSPTSTTSRKSLNNNNNKNSPCWRPRHSVTSIVNVQPTTTYDVQHSQEDGGVQTSPTSQRRRLWRDRNSKILVVTPSSAAATSHHEEEEGDVAVTKQPKCAATKDEKQTPKRRLWRDRNQTSSTKVYPSVISSSSPGVERRSSRTHGRKDRRC